MHFATLLPYLAVIWLAFYVAVIAGIRYLLPHHSSVVLCPKCKLPAAVEVDGQLAVEVCSRWSQVQQCDLSCLSQLWFSAEDTKGFNARQKDCGMCGSALTSSDWYANRLAAATAGIDLEWIDELRSRGEGQALCSNCLQPHSATTKILP